MYVVTRPGRELLFTVVSQEEKYKAKVNINFITIDCEKFCTCQPDANYSVRMLLNSIY